MICRDSFKIGVAGTNLSAKINACVINVCAHQAVRKCKMYKRGIKMILPNSLCASRILFNDSRFEKSIKSLERG